MGAGAAGSGFLDEEARARYWTDAAGMRKGRAPSCSGCGSPPRERPM